MKDFFISHRLITFLVCCLFVANGVSAIAQTSSLPVISVDFNGATLEKIAQEIESKCDFRIYYDAKATDSIRITAKVNQQPINIALSRIFENSSLNFTIYKKNIFIVSGNNISTGVTDENEMSKPGISDTQKKNFIALDRQERIQESITPNKIYEIGIRTNELRKGTAVIAGYVRDQKTGEPISGARIITADQKYNTTSSSTGLYSLSLPYGAHTLEVKAGANRDSYRKIMVYGDGRLNIDLQERFISLKEVRILAERVSNTKSLEMGANHLDIKTIKKIPSVFGEADVLRAVLTLPGVQTVGEASTGFNVRGGSADQNLILLNDATIYNPSHFFGFFSAFNPDIVKDVQLYKSSVPEKFGGRLASVLEVTNRNGDKGKYTGSAGIGLLTSRFNIEGPIDSGRTSFIFGGRGTYSDWLLKLLPNAYKNSAASFYDFNLNIHHQLNEKNTIEFTGYYSKDNFKLNSDTTYGYNNKNFSLKWQHKFNEALKASLILASDRYNYRIESDQNPVNAYKLDFDINQSSLKYDFTHKLKEKHALKYGISMIHYKLNAGNFIPLGNESLVSPDHLESEQALESALYFGDEFEINKVFSINAGLRYSFYNYLGPKTVNYYAPDIPVTEDNQTGSITYKKNKFINTYHGPEIRVSMRYSLKPDLSLKAAYNSLRQYIHLLSNSTAIAPTDSWKLSDPNIKPQTGNQVSLGLYKNFASQIYESSVEIYYKTMRDFLDYRSGANLILNHHIETDVVGTKGKAYGVEFLLKKNYGKLNGWMSYTYSRVQLKMDDPSKGMLINGGRDYPANYDKPHAFNFTGNYRFKYRYNLSLNITYSTGRPITLPVARYDYGGSQRVYYSDRNAYRIPDYFRSDISFNIEGNHKINQLTHNSWTIGFYNITGRKNAFSTFFTQERGIIQGYQLSIFASVIPFINYNIRF